MPALGPPDVLPAALVPDLKGRPRPLDELWTPGGGLLVVGHADCGTTRLALPYLERIHRGGGRVAVILQEDEAGARAVVANHRLTLPVRLDVDPYRLSEALALETVPTHYHVDAGGAVLEILQGFRGDAYERLALALGAPSPFRPGDTVPALRPG